MLWFEVRIQFGTNPVTDDTVAGNNKVDQKCKWNNNNNSNNNNNDKVYPKCKWEQERNRRVGMLRHLDKLC